MAYQKIKPKKIYEEVAEALHEMIRKGELKPGEKLDSVQQLAENFQVGRSAIREALTALKAMGLVEMRQGEGTFVREFDASAMIFPLSTAILMNQKDIKHLLQVRKILEGGAAALAAENRTESDIETLTQALKEMKEAVGNKELGEQSDLNFHLAIAGASKNPMLGQLMNTVSDMMVETMKETRRIWLYSEETTMERLHWEHAQILEAVVEQNGFKAQNFMMSHLEHVEKILNRYVNQSQPGS
ncbi:FadR/GntR family transcriptional regulator [Fictibacillus fluitans]|uniref:FadR/GntR family transcriptional regulator n=1 Tax=Fictibacillus fluitans TaxID=3058422 RepID=A0ABT8HR07_9BACL|nr:FadR/GntR family transcriptional regulator [Fictibacillus sp. NE201]MDN4522950.1 FadR/GntR family transcriptional regulator [Fictibacillus sp. NE201]